MVSSALDTAAVTLGQLVGLSPPEALARLDAIVDALPSCGSPERLDAIAAAIPRRVATLASEVCLALADVALDLGGHNPRLPEDLDSLEPRVQVAWLRVRLRAYSVIQPSQPSQPNHPIEETLLLRALGSWSLSSAADPAALLECMARADDPRLRIAVFEHVDPAVDELALSPDQACACLLSLVDDPEPSVRRAAFAALSKRSLTRLSPALHLARDRCVHAGLRDADPAIVRTCVSAAANAGERAWLVDLAFGDDSSDAHAVAALEGLGPLAEDEDLDPALALARRDPLRYAAVVREFLLAAHRRGTFVHEPQVLALIDSFDQHCGWTGEAFVRVTHIARARVLAALAELPADDRRWIRRAQILAASLDARAPALITELLRTTRDPRIAAALIDAAGRSPFAIDEQSSCAWLAELPESVIPVLRVKGGEAAAKQLRALALDRRCPARVRPLAIGALWALSRDRRALLRELCTSLGPHAGGLLDPNRLSTRDDQSAKILADAPWSPDPDHAIEPLDALRLLCEAGKIELLPAITSLFRRVFNDYVRDALAGDFTIKRVRMPELEQQIYRYARHLIADGRSVRRWIEVDPETGRDLILSLAIDWLSEDPPAPVSVALLETIARQQPTGASLRQIEQFWRHRDPEVRRAAIEAILAAGEDARGLELSICRLSDASDPRIVRQALAGVASLAAGWAEPTVVAALARPEMGVKKAAADALAVVGTRRCVSALVDWLGYHDNASFRSDLLEALRAVATTGVSAILVDALAGAAEPRRRALLRDALSGMLGLPAALRLARSQRPSDLELVQGMLDGELELAAGTSRVELAAALHRAKLRTLPEPDDPTRRLRIDGFGVEAALALLDVERPKHDAVIHAVIRDSLGDWLTWLARDDRPSGAAYLSALTLTLETVTSTQVEQFDALLALTEPALTELDPSVVADFIERCLSPSDVGVVHRARALAMLRALPISPEVGGLRRFRLLHELDAVRDRRDLERCLAECTIGPKLERESEQLLCEAFEIPPARTDEALDLGVAAAAKNEALRERAKAWYRTSPSDNEAWLSELLATRPLDLAALEPRPKPEQERRKPAFVPRSREDLDALLAIVRGKGPVGQRDRQTRERAAERIAAWADGRTIAASGAQVLELYLAGEIELSDSATTTLARTLDAWPPSISTPARARALFDALDLAQRRRFLPTWIDAWERGDAQAEALLCALDPELLIPAAGAQAGVGNYALLRLLRPSKALGKSLALRELIEFVSPRAPDEVTHLINPRAPEPDEQTTPLDPIAGMDIDALVATIRDPKLDVGLAVRAIHALTPFDERGADALEPLTLDRRPRVRSAALRALRRVASRDRCMEAIIAVLAIEDRRDVTVSLLASLGHGRYRPALPRLFSYLNHREPKLCEAAENAVLAWGDDLLPELRRAARKARPDRRPRYEALIEELER